MSRPRSELLSSLGKLFEIFKKVLDAVLRLGGTDEHVAEIGTNEVLAKNVAAVICGAATVVLNEELTPAEKVLEKLFSEQLQGNSIVDFCLESRFILRGELLKALRKLTYRERNIIEMRLGLFDGKPWDLADTARSCNTPKERVRQIEARAIGKLRSGLHILQEFRNAIAIKEGRSIALDITQDHDQ